MKNKKMFLVVLALLAGTTGLQAQDWPQYLGPERNSTSDQTGLLRSWPEQGPEILWAIHVGIGYGGPVVKDGKVYLLDRDDAVGDNLRCIDLEDGAELWNFKYDAPGKVMYPGSRSVPVAEGNYIYSCGPYGDLYCVDATTHTAVWNKNVWKDFGGQEIPTWAISQCPLIYNDLLIIASQAPGAGVVAYDKRTGAVKWRTPSLGQVGYVSPSIVKIDGEDQVVMITASSRRGGEMGNVVGIHPLTGEMLWKYSGWNCRIPIPSAVDAGNNKVLVMGGYELGAAMLKVEKTTHGTFEATEIFTTEEFGDQTKPAVLHEGYFYAQYGTNNRRDGLVCMSMEGEVMWKTKRDPDFNKGSMVLADGLLLATDGNQTLYLIEPDPSGFKLIASAALLREEETNGEGVTSQGGGSKQNWAPIALSEGKLLIRDHSRMICVKVAR